MVTYINASGQTHASDEYIHTYVLTHSLTHTQSQTLTYAHNHYRSRKWRPQNYEQLPPVLPLSAKLGAMVQKSGWPPRYRALLWAMAGNEVRRTAEANGSTYEQVKKHAHFYRRNTATNLLFRNPSYASVDTPTHLPITHITHTHTHTHTHIGMTWHCSCSRINGLPTPPPA